MSTNQSIPAEQSLFEQIQATAKQARLRRELEPARPLELVRGARRRRYELVSAPYTKVGPDVLRILYDSAGITPAPSGYFANHAQRRATRARRTLLTAGARDEPTPTSGPRSTQQAQQIVLEGYYILPLYDQQNHFLHEHRRAGRPGHADGLDADASSTPGSTRVSARPRGPRVRRVDPRALRAVGRSAARLRALGGRDR